MTGDVIQSKNIQEENGRLTVGWKFFPDGRAEFAPFQVENRPSDAARIEALEKEVADLKDPQRYKAVRKNISDMIGNLMLGQASAAAAGGLEGKVTGEHVRFEIGESFDNEGQPLFTTTGPVSMRVDYLRALLRKSIGIHDVAGSC